MNEYIEYIESIAHRMVIDKLSTIINDPVNLPYYLSTSPHLRYSDVAANKTADWDWYLLSANPGITLQDILSHPDDPWKWSDLDMTGYGVSMNPGIRFQDVLQHLDKPWDWLDLSGNETVTMDIVMTHLGRLWDWYLLSMNPGIRWSDIQAHPDLPWDYEALSQRPISDEQIIISNYNEWDWGYVSEKASFDLIRDHPDWPWDWNGICRNYNVPLAFIPDERRDYYLSCNHNTSIQDIVDHPDVDWPWTYLSGRIDFQDILRHPELPWDFNSMSQNPGLRLDYVMMHKDESWNTFQLSRNSFEYDFTDYYTLLARQHMAALKIQLYWRKYATDHRYLICHRVQLGRLSSEFI